MIDPTTLHGWDCLSELRGENDTIVLSASQREWAFTMARLKLLDDPAVRQRLRDLQVACCQEVMAMVLKHHGCPPDTKTRITL